MPIVEGLIEKVEAALVAVGYNRMDVGPPSNAARIAAATTRKHFEDYEEVEVRHNQYDAHLYRVEASIALGSSEYATPTLRALIFKPAPEQVTLSREAVAVLAEHYESTPEKDAAGSAALAEAKKVL